MKYIEEHHKASFDTTYTVLRSCWGSPVAKKWSKKQQNVAESCQNHDLWHSEEQFINLVFFFGSKLLKDIRNSHLRPFTLICDHFESPQKKKSGENRVKIRIWKLQIGLFLWLFLSFLSKSIRDTINFQLRLFRLTCGHFAASSGQRMAKIWFWKMPKPQFKAFHGLFQLFVLIFLMKYIKEHHKASFETIYPIVWLYWGSKEQKIDPKSAKKWLKTTKKVICGFFRLGLFIWSTLFDQNYSETLHPLIWDHLHSYVIILKLLSSRKSC